MKSQTIKSLGFILTLALSFFMGMFIPVLMNNVFLTLVAGMAVGFFSGIIGFNITEHLAERYGE